MFLPESLRDLVLSGIVFFVVILAYNITLLIKPERLFKFCKQDPG